MLLEESSAEADIIMGEKLGAAGEDESSSSLMVEKKDSLMQAGDMGKGGGAGGEGGRGGDVGKANSTMEDIESESKGTSESIVDMGEKKGNKKFARRFMYRCFGQACRICQGCLGKAFSAFDLIMKVFGKVCRGKLLPVEPQEQRV